MSADAVMQLLVLAAEAVAVCSLLLVFFSLRAHYGFAPLYVTLGGFQHLQTLMAATLYIEVFPGIGVCSRWMQADRLTGMPLLIWMVSGRNPKLRTPSLISSALEHSSDFSNAKTKNVTISSWVHPIVNGARTDAAPAPEEKRRESLTGKGGYCPVPNTA